VVHCKGGKGRTGTCIATWLLATDFFTTADDALSPEFYKVKYSIFRKL